jgi:hypothetical protein
VQQRILRGSFSRPQTKESLHQRVFMTQNSFAMNGLFEQ